MARRSTNARRRFASRDERDALWQGLIDGDIDLVASDHSPCPPAMKNSDGDFFGAGAGSRRFSCTLPAVWTGARERGPMPEAFRWWMCRLRRASLG